MAVLTGYDFLRLFTISFFLVVAKTSVFTKVAISNPNHHKDN